MTRRTRHFRAVYMLASLLLLGVAVSEAGYKARPWVIHERSSYPSVLASEGVTIAVQPLFTDELAAQVFDKNDMVTRGIMPLAVVIFNDNDYPVAVDGGAIELICGDDRLHTLPVNEVVHRLFQKGTKASWVPIPRVPSIDRGNLDAFDDFDRKFLGDRSVGGHEKGGGFLFFHVPSATDGLPGVLSQSRVYIPEVHRQDTGAELMFFEIELKPAMQAGPAK